MAGRIPIYRRVADVLRMRWGNADRGICTSFHRYLRALSPAIAQFGETAWLNPSRQFAAVLRQPDTLGREHGELASWNVPSARHRPGQAANR